VIVWEASEPKHYAQKELKKKFQQNKVVCKLRLKLSGVVLQNNDPLKKMIPKTFEMV